MGEYGREQRNQLSRAISNRTSTNQLKKVMDFRAPKIGVRFVTKSPIHNEKNSFSLRNEKFDTKPIQMVVANVFAGFKGEAMTNLGGGEEGVGHSVSAFSDHAERQAWIDSADEVKKLAKNDENKNKRLVVYICVDKGICLHCQMWMENVLLGMLKNWDKQFGRDSENSTQLIVEVKLKKKPPIVREVIKGETDWSGISYTPTKTLRTLSKSERKMIKRESLGL